MASCDVLGADNSSLGDAVQVLATNQCVHLLSEMWIGWTFFNLMHFLRGIITSWTLKELRGVVLVKPHFY